MMWLAWALLAAAAARARAAALACDACGGRLPGETWCDDAAANPTAPTYQQLECAVCTDCCEASGIQSCCVATEYNQRTRVAAARCLGGAVSVFGGGQVTFPLGAFVLTRGALRELPDRFRFLIEEFVQALVNVEVDDVNTGGLGQRLQVSCPNNNTQFRDIGVNYEESSFEFIVDESNSQGGVRIRSEITVVFRCIYSVQNDLIVVIKDTCKDAQMLLKYQGPIEIDLNMEHRPDTAQFLVTPSISVWSDWDDITLSCGQDVLDGLRRVTSIGPDNFNLIKKGEDWLTSKLEAVVVDYLVFPPSWEPYTNLFVDYRVTHMDFVGDEYIAIGASGNVSALLPDGRRVYHEFGGAEAAAAAAAIAAGDGTAAAGDVQAPPPLREPPLDWAEPLRDKSGTPLLAGLRISSDLMTALANATRMLSPSFSDEVEFSGSRVTYNISFATPRFAVTGDGQLQTRFSNAEGAVQCQSEPNVGLDLIDLATNNIQATMGLTYVDREMAYADAVERIEELLADDKIDAKFEPRDEHLFVGMVVGINNLTFDAAAIELTAPPVPFDTTVLRNMVQSVLESQRATINDLLRQFPMALTDELKPYFPHPAIRAHAIDTTIGQGYIEAATRCRCDLAPPSSNVGFNELDPGIVDACGFRCEAQPAAQQRRRKRASPPQFTFYDGLAGRRVRRSARRLHHHERRQASPADVAQNELFMLQVYNNANCRLDSRGFVSHIVALRDTESQCVFHEPLITAFGESGGAYYALSVTTDPATQERRATLEVACNSECRECTATESNVQLAPGKCSLANELVAESFVLQPWTPAVCVGGNLWRYQPSDPVIGVRQLWSGGVTTADYCPAAADDPTARRGTIVFPDTLTSFGRTSEAAQLAQCEDLSPQGGVGLGGRNYAQVVFNSTFVSTARLNCQRETAGCSACRTSLAGVAVGQCQTPSLDPVVIAGAEVGVTTFGAVQIADCGFDDDRYVPPNTPPPAVAPNGTMVFTEGSAAEEVSYVALMLGILAPLACCACIVVSTLCYACGWFTHLVSFYRNHTWTFGAPPAGRRYMFIFVAFAAFATLIQALVWTAGRSIDFVSAEYFSDTLGVPPRYIHAEDFAARFRLWYQSGALVLIVIAIVTIGLLVDAMMTRHRKVVEGNPLYAANAGGRPTDEEREREDEERDARRSRRKVGLRVRRYLWIALLHLQTFLFLVCPLFVAFQMLQTIVVTPLDNSLVGATREVLEGVLNASGAAIVFNLIMDFFINLWQLLPAGVMFGTLIFLADMGISVDDDTVLISRGLWVTAASVNVTMHLIVPMALCPAILISVHRYNVMRAWWLLLVWVVLWFVQLMLVYAAMFRNVTLAVDRGQLEVRPHRAMFFYMLSTVVLTAALVIGDFLYQDSTSLFSFMLFYRLTTFFLTGCYVRVWLEAYRPKWSMAIVGKAQAEQKKLDDQRDAERRAAAAAANQTVRQRARNAAFLYFENVDDDAAAAGLRRGNGAGDRLAGGATSCVELLSKFVLVPLLAPVFATSYAIERGRPATDSLPRRRTWLLFGVLFGFIIAFDSIIHVAQFDAKADWIDWIEAQDDRLLFGFSWPDGPAGSILDAGFELYTQLSIIKTVCVFVCMSIVLGMLIDDFRSAAVSQAACQRSVIRQTWAGCAMFTILFLAVLAPSTPDYPRVANFGDTLPQCGEDFNVVVRKMYGGAMGLILTVVAIKGLIAVVLVMLPSNLRGARMIISAALHALDPDDHADHDDHATGCMRFIKWHPPLGPAPPAVIDHALVMYQLSAIVSPLVTGIPMLFFYLFDSDATMLILYLANWILPAVTANAMTPKFIDLNYLLAVWVFFFPTLLAVILIKLDQYGLLDIDVVIVALKSWSFWTLAITTLAEICLANVIVADIIYYIIWQLYPDYSVASSQFGGTSDFGADKVDVLNEDFTSAPTMRGGGHTMRSSKEPSNRTNRSVANSRQFNNTASRNVNTEDSQINRGALDDDTPAAYSAGATANFY